MSTGTFHVAVFTPDGRLEGTGIRRISDLSPKWLEVCRGMFSGSAGVVSVPAERLDHLSVRFTRSEGAMLATFNAHGQLAVSCLMLDGRSPAVEDEVIGMFVDSLRQSPFTPQGSGATFAGLRELTGRPLQVLIPWMNPQVTEGDHGLLQELTAHVGGALLGSTPIASQE